MRIVTWNCNGALRKKLSALLSLDADIFIVQECEDPSKCKSKEYRNWASNYLWLGANKNMGLGVFARPGIKLEASDLESEGLQSFIPCTIDHKLLLLAVWTRQANSPTFGYIGQLWKYLQRHKKALSGQDTLVIGDFNSNSCWDLWDRWWNHSDVVAELCALDVHSLYHKVTGEAQGHESQATFYMYRKREKPYHIDYAFLSGRLLGTSSLIIGKPEKWLEHSDHMPLVVELV
jgi:endonuclease/exonuclease/phosphatase family metal-dependent hydrolase